MMDVKIYGTGTSGHQMVVSTVGRYLHFAGLNFQLEEITDVNEFLRMKIESVPAILIDDKNIYNIKQNGEFNISLQNALSDILKHANFGKIPKIIIPFDSSDAAFNAFYYGKRFLTGSISVIKILKTFANKNIEGSKTKEEEQKLYNIITRIKSGWINEVVTDSPFVDADIRYGEPSETILASAKDNSAELAIFGIDNDSNSIANMFKQTLVDVLNKSACQVLGIPQLTRFKGIHNILFVNQESGIDKIVELLKFTARFNPTVHIFNGSKSKKNNILDTTTIEMDFPNVTFIQLNAQSEMIENEIESYSIANSIDLLSFDKKDVDSLPLFNTNKTLDNPELSMPFLIV